LLRSFVSPRPNTAEGCPGPETENSPLRRDNDRMSPVAGIESNTLVSHSLIADKSHFPQSDFSVLIILAEHLT